MSSVILAARDAVTPPPDVPGGTPGDVIVVPPVRPVPPPERQTIDLLGVNGDVIRLTDGQNGVGLYVAADPAPYGFWLSEYESDTEVTPGVDGARYGDVRAAPRPVGLTVSFALSTVVDRREFADRLVRALNPKRGLAGFLVTEPDSTARMITGRYAGGEEQWRPFRQNGAWGIDLLAADEPYWTDAPGSELPERTWRAADPVDYYPYLPMQLSEDTAVGEPVDIDNDGHEEAYPDWLIAGPATSALFANDTTGETLSWAGVLLAGQWIAIVTRPGMQEVVDSSGASRFHELDQDPEPSFWSLGAGVNRVRTVIGGIGAGTSVTLLPLTRRWLIQG